MLIWGFGLKAVEGVSQQLWMLVYGKAAGRTTQAGRPQSAWANRGCREPRLEGSIHILYAPVGRKICRMWRNESMWLGIMRLGNERFCCFSLPVWAFVVRISGSTPWMKSAVCVSFTSVYPAFCPFLSTRGKRGRWMIPYMLLSKFPYSAPYQATLVTDLASSHHATTIPRTASGATPRSDVFRRRNMCLPFHSRES